MLRYIAVLLLFFSLATQGIWAQKPSSETFIPSQERILAFSKGPSKRMMFKVGAPIELKIFNQKQKIKANIIRITDTAIFLPGRILPIKQIESVYVSQRSAKIVGTTLFIAGGGYVILDLINGLINQRAPVISPKAWPVAAIGVAGGLITLPFRKVKRKTSDWRPMVLILDTY